MGQTNGKDAMNKVLIDPTALESLKKLFSKYDADKNGNLDRQEARVFLKDFMRLVDKGQCQGVDAPWQRREHSRADYITMLIKRIDANNDEKITFDEFEAFFQEQAWSVYEMPHFSVSYPVSWMQTLSRSLKHTSSEDPEPFKDSTVFTSPYATKLKKQVVDRVVLKLEAMAHGVEKWHESYVSKLSSAKTVKEFSKCDIAISGCDAYAANIIYNDGEQVIEESIMYIEAEAKLVFILQYQTWSTTKNKQNDIFEAISKSLVVKPIGKLISDYGRFTLAGKFDCKCKYPWEWTQGKVEGIMISPLEQYCDKVIDRLDFTKGIKNKTAADYVKKLEGNPDIKIVKRGSWGKKAKGTSDKVYNVYVIETNSDKSKKIQYIVSLEEELTFSFLYESNVGLVNRSIVEALIKNAIKFTVSLAYSTYLKNNVN